MKLKLAITTLAFTILALSGIARAQDNPSDSTQMVTGCLQKGANANTYTLTDENGKLWDLHSKTVQLGPHAGHTVSITGTIPPKPKDNGDTSPQNHLQVTNLKMVSDTCQQKQ